MFSLAGLGTVIGGALGFTDLFKDSDDAATATNMLGEVGSWFDRPDSPMTGAQMGKEAMHFWKNAYPGVTPWEAAGGGAGNAPTSAGAAMFNQQSEQDMRREQMDQERSLAQANMSLQLRLADKANMAKLLEMYTEDPRKAAEALKFYRSSELSDLTATEGNFQLNQNRFKLDQSEVNAKIGLMSAQEQAALAETTLTHLKSQLEQGRYDLESLDRMIDWKRVEAEWHKAKFGGMWNWLGTGANAAAELTPSFQETVRGAFEMLPQATQEDMRTIAEAAVGYMEDNGRNFEAGLIRSLIEWAGRSTTSGVGGMQTPNSGG